VNEILWDAPTFVCKEFSYATCKTIQHTYYARHLAYLSNHTHIFAKHFLPPIYFIWTTFLLYVHILFTYMVIHLRGSFMLCTFIHIYTHLKSNFMLHIHWKGNFCITNLYFWKAISCHIFLFWEAFWCHIQHTCTLAKYLATYSIYICTWWTTFSHHLGTKKSSWCSPNQVLA